MTVLGLTGVISYYTRSRDRPIDLNSFLQLDNYYDILVINKINQVGID